MYLGWIWVVSFILCIAVGLEGVGELRREGQSGEGCEPRRRSCEPQGAGRSDEPCERAGCQHGWSFSGTVSCISSPASHSPGFPVAHNQAFPSIPWELSPGVTQTQTRLVPLQVDTSSLEVALSLG